MRRSVGRSSAGGPLYLALPGSNQQESKPLLIQLDRFSDTVLSHNSRFGKLKSNEEKEKVLGSLKSDQRFNAVFMKIWRVAVVEDVSLEDLPTIQIPSQTFFNLMALIERAFLSVRPEMVRHFISSQEQSALNVFMKNQMTIADMQEYVLRCVFGEFLGFMSAVQVEQTLRDIHTRITDRDPTTGNYTLVSLDMIPLVADTSESENRTVEKRLNLRIQ